MRTLFEGMTRQSAMHPGAAASNRCTPSQCIPDDAPHLPERTLMDIDSVLTKAYAMPLTSPAFPMGPYRFVGREFFIITYRTDPARLREVVPEPLEIGEPLVHYEFIR